MDIEELRAAVDAAGPSAPGRRFSFMPVGVPITELGAPTLRLTTPEGFVVEGLDVGAVAELIRALR